MLLFLAGVIEQLDLAFEHISKGGSHDARFGLMLTDNAVELILHQIAKDRNDRLKSFSILYRDYERKDELVEALGRSFEAKLKFARIEGVLTDRLSHTIGILHSFRNEVYHIGLQHEAILPALAALYFDTACEFLQGYKPFGLGWGSNQKLPERAKKYFKGDERFMPGGFDDFPNALRALSKLAAFDPKTVVGSLADEMDRVVDNCDTCLDIVADGVYVGQQKSRDEAVIDCQAWPLAFTAAGQAFASEAGWTGKNPFQLSEWLAANHTFKVKRDPLPSWRKQVDRLRQQRDAHKALSNYQSFMTSTAAFREVLLESASAAEAEIDRIIDQRRGK